MNDVFIHIWNQLALMTSFEFYGDPESSFISLQQQTDKAKEENKITVRQYLALKNIIAEWRDIRYGG